MAIKKTKAVKKPVAPAKKPVAKKATGKKPGRPAKNVIAERQGKVIKRDGATLLKVFDATFSKANVLNEALNEARAEETGLPVPKLLEVFKIGDKWAIRREYVEGQTLAEIMAADKKHAEKHLAKFAQIHLEILARRSPLMNSQRAKLESALDRAELDEVQRYDLKMRLDSLPKDEAVCHGDLDPTNVIIRPDGSWMVIDWSHARKGNALADVARSYLLLWLSAHHGAAETYLDIMCKALKVQKSVVQQWMPIVAATLSTRSENAKNKPVLLHWASVVDYV